MLVTTTPTPTIRQLGPRDADALLALHAEIGDEDSYFRFLQPRPRDLPKVAESLALGHTEQCAVGAFLDDQLLGVANYVLVDDVADTAEVAMVDAAKHSRRIGAELLDALVTLARRNGVHRLMADVLATNSRMVRLLLDAHWPVTAYRDGSLVRVGVQID